MMTSKAAKLERKALLEHQKRFKPSECQKYMRVLLDKNLFNTKLGNELMKLLLSDTTIHWTFELRTLPEPNCIIWERNVGQRTLVTTSALNAEWETESEIVRLIHIHQLIEDNQARYLSTMGERMRCAFPNKQYTLLILGDNSKFTSITKIIVNLQLVQELYIQQAAEDAQEVFEFLKRFTKSIAEKPHKMEEYDLLSRFRIYMGKEKIRCVKVNGTNGLHRLWQQHLMCLPLVSLEVAETIMERFSCPRKLLEEYANNPKAVDDIANLKIRRSGMLTTSQTDRRIGRALSEKLYRLYNSENPDELL